MRKIYMMFITISLIAQISIAQVPTNGLVAYYPFNGNANDESSNNNNGTVNGAILTTDRFGNENSAYSFDGIGSYIEIPNSQSLNNFPNNCQTISLWVKLTNYPSNSKLYFMVDKTDQSRHSYYQVAIRDLSNLKYFYYTFSNGSISNYFFSDDYGQIPLNIYTHIVVITNNSNTYYYKDGELISSVTNTAGSGFDINNNVSLRFGRTSFETSQTAYFKGILDDIAIYDRALSEIEIQTLYNEGGWEENSNDGLVAYYPFNGNANDESGNGHNFISGYAELAEDRYGKSENAYYFNGTSDFFELDGQLTLNTDITMISWIKPDNGTKWSMPLCIGNGSMNIRLSYDPIKQKAGFNGWYSGITGIEWGNTILSKGNWYQLVGVRKGDNWKLYINGTLDSEVIGKNYTQSNLNIAVSKNAYSSYNQDYFKGVIDDIAVYNRALSESEIGELYDNYYVEPVEDFVKIKNGQFYLNENPFRFISTNAHWLVKKYAYNEGQDSDSFLESCKKNGFDVVRTWAFHDSDNVELDDNENIVPKDPAVIQFGPFKNYNEVGLRALDAAINSASNNDIKLILSLVNNWDAYGGIPQYLKWTGSTDISTFYNLDAEPTRIFKEYIDTLLNRKNTFKNGLKYKDDPTIMAWEIINEPRNTPYIGHFQLKNWLTNIADHIKKNDKNHLITTGEEGFDSTPIGYSLFYGKPEYLIQNFSGQQGVSFTDNLTIKNIDFSSIHLYPEDWWDTEGWFLKDTEYFSYSGYIWIRDHALKAKKANKPLFIGEFGVPMIDQDTDNMSIYSTWLSSINEWPEVIQGALVWHYTHVLDTNKVDIDKFSFSDITHPEIIKLMQDYKIQLRNNSRSYKNLSALNEPRASSTSQIYNNSIYVFGGTNSASNTNLKKVSEISTLEKYNIDSGFWETIPDIQIPGFGIGSVIIDDIIYLIGGTENPKSLLAYNLSQNQIDTRATMLNERINCTAIEHNGKIYVFGGYDSKNNDISSVEVYDPNSNTWTEISSMKNSRSGMASAKIGNSAYILGGYSFNKDSIYNSVDVFNLDDFSWSTSKELTKARYNAKAILLDNYIYLFGGMLADSITTSRIEKLELNTSNWETVGNLPYPNESFSLIKNEANRIFILGGNTGYDNYLSDVIEYGSDIAVGVSNDIEQNEIIANNYKLYQNYPNPFNPTTTISYTIPQNEYVSLKLFDVLGREVKTLIDEQMSKGNYKIELNASTFSSGIYFYKIQAGNFLETKKMLIIK